ncbi:MAG: AAA family ATPase, partial [Oscillospiraceae bacterium]|nr:AAA family ATPase [Oscillospiraceae bacterium]
EGKQDLFEGLKIENLVSGYPEAWEPHPVFYLDFNKAGFQENGALEAILLVHLEEWENRYGQTSKDVPLGARFGQLLRKACEQTGKRCAVLVDEYDKPLLETMDDKKLVEHNKTVFKSFFSCLKSEDAYIRFIFITGVTKFSKISIFSDLNQLRDISMTADYAGICGITEQEMKDNLMPEIKAMANELEMTTDECFERLKKAYDGYHFHHRSEGVCNPFSLLSALTDREFDSYWFETGTPAFLVRRLKEINFDVRKFTDKTLYATKQMLKDYRDDNPDPIPVLYQTGYLTIEDYDPRKNAYTLVFPNDEVKYGFLNSLLPTYVEGVGAGSGKDILTLIRYLEEGDTEQIMKVFMGLFAGIPYQSGDDPFEHDFQTVFYITLTLLKQYVICEQHTYTGRIDCVIETDRFVYIFEFKRDRSADDALKQIEDMDYAAPYIADERKLYKIGVNFDSKTRKLVEWKVAEDKNE